MSWTKFKNDVVRKMKKGPSSLEETAKIIASSYDRAVRSAQSGDKVGFNRLIKGNKEGFEKYITRILKAQSKSITATPIHNLIAKGFPIYWLGGQLSTEKIPATPAPGAIVNVSVVVNTVDFPGAPVEIPVPLGKSQSTEQFVNNLVKVAKLHLNTLSGSTKTISQYPVIPPGTVPGPGIILWTGYVVPE